MSPRTVAPPPTDRSMWRQLRALAHPDGSGGHSLFVWVEVWPALEMELLLSESLKGEGGGSS